MDSRSLGIWKVSQLNNKLDWLDTTQGQDYLVGYNNTYPEKIPYNTVVVVMQEEPFSTRNWWWGQLLKLTIPETG